MAGLDSDCGGSVPFVAATLRDYQVDGVNWMVKQYNRGVGGILGDEVRTQSMHAYHFESFHLLIKQAGRLAVSRNRQLGGEPTGASRRALTWKKPDIFVFMKK